MNKLLTAVAVVALLLPAAASARDVANSLKSFAALNIKPWLDEPVLIEAIKAQNAKTKGYEQDKIDTLDGVWRESAKGDATDPLILDVVTGPASDYLRGKFDSSGGIIVEVILMDAKGLNVAATKPTSDYWQGDEPKFQNSFGAGKDGVDTGEVSLDQSTGKYTAQISYPVADPATGELIGAITVGVSIAGLD